MVDATVVSLSSGRLIGTEVDGVGPKWKQPLWDIGEAAFTLTTDTQVELATTLTVCQGVFLLPKTVPGTAADDTLYSDGVVTSAAITIERFQPVADNLAFWYFLFGY